jgi:hypothetical protein
MVEDLGHSHSPSLTVLERAAIPLEHTARAAARPPASASTRAAASLPPLLSLSLSPSRRLNGVTFHALGVHSTPILPNRRLGALGGRHTCFSRGAADAQGLPAPRRLGVA